MDQQKIELRKVRDFGENIGDTFQFIKQEFKPLVLCFMAFAGVFIVVTGILSGIFQQEASNVFASLVRNAKYDRNFTSIFTGTYFLILFFSLLNVVAMKVTLACYMKVYDANGGTSPTLEEVWNEFRKYIIPLFLYSILILVIIIIGTVCCIVPGVYFMVVFAPINLIYVIENVSMGEGINRCFRIIKDNFWMTFGIYIVSYLIYLFSSMIISLAIGVVVGLISYFSTENLHTTIAWVTGVLSILQHVFYIVFFVSVALNYFSLTERQDGEGLLRRLEGLGDHNAHSQTEEQY